MDTVNIMDVFEPMDTKVVKLLIRGSLVRVQQGEPNKKQIATRRSAFCFPFFVGFQPAPSRLPFSAERSEALTAMFAQSANLHS